MSNLILCRGNYAEKPYVLKSVSLPVFSIEELCFYLCENIYMLDESLLDKELCDWVSQEVGLSALGQRMAEAVRRAVSLGAFVSMILEEVRYVGGEELSILKRMFKESRGASAGQRRKYKADYLQNAGRIAEAMREYCAILQEKEPDEALAAGVRHNMGTACARLFLFEQAAAYFYLAYEADGGEDSFYQYLAASRMYMEDAAYEALLQKEQASSGQPVYQFAEKIRETMSEAVAKNGGSDYDKIMGRLTGLGKREPEGLYEEAERLLYDMKEEYRKMLSGSIQ